MAKGNSPVTWNTHPVCNDMDIYIEPSKLRITAKKKSENFWGKGGDKLKHPEKEFPIWVINQITLSTLSQPIQPQFGTGLHWKLTYDGMVSHSKSQ